MNIRPQATHPTPSGEQHAPPSQDRHRPARLSSHGNANVGRMQVRIRVALPRSGQAALLEVSLPRSGSASCCRPREAHPA